MVGTERYGGVPEPSRERGERMASRGGFVPIVPFFPWGPAETPVQIDLRSPCRACGIRQLCDSDCGIFQIVPGKETTSLEEQKEVVDRTGNLHGKNQRSWPVDLVQHGHLIRLSDRRECQLL